MSLETFLLHNKSLGCHDGGKNPLAIATWQEKSLVRKSIPTWQ